MQDLHIKDSPVNRKTLDEYSAIQINYTVTSIFKVELVNNGLGGLHLREEKVAQPYFKNYDALDFGEGPTRWIKTFNTDKWRLFVARRDGEAIGGITVVTRTPEVRLLKGRTDLAVVWDLRVHPGHRRSGIGSKLFSTAVEWARHRGFRQLSVETQNTNVPACRFYAAQGCTLGEIGRFKYATQPAIAHEVMLIWYLDL